MTKDRATMYQGIINSKQVWVVVTGWKIGPNSFNHFHTGYDDPAEAAKVLGDWNWGLDQSRSV